MRRIHVYLTAALVSVPLLSMASCAGGHGDGFASDQSDQELLNSIPKHPHTNLCDAVRPGGGMMRCHAKARVHPSTGQVLLAATPSGLTPSDLKSAYNLPSTGGGGATIAIVDAMDSPNAESDMGVYRAQFGLPPCTTANGCFKKVNQNGVQGSYPAADNGWAGEIALDLDMASAICPSCKILLVEANSASMNDLGAAVNRAVAMGATVVSNSYGGAEDSSSASASAQFFDHPGVFITVSSGDNGYGVEFPASSEHVTAVGGTSLVKSSSARGWTEGAWSGAGSGCSAFIAKPSWQKDTACAKRTVADVSAVADPNTGVAVYFGGWSVYGGTSASAPIVAAAYALTAHGGADGSYAYGHTSAYYDVSKGSNGTCGGSYLCTSLVGYDGPTGLGTPNGAALAGGGGGGTPDAGGGTPDSGGGGGSCAHPICTSGTNLTSACDPCAAKICAADSYCCSTAWDSTCVGEVASICGQSCSAPPPPPPPPPPPGSCAHPICASGTKLTSGCDPCATKVCAADSYCCSTAWDSICVGEVQSVCGQTCP